MKFDRILCHYAEIGLKGKNRKQFENRLKENIKTCLKSYCPDTAQFVKRIQGRILVGLTEKGQRSTDNISAILGNVFGIAYFAFAVETNQDIRIIKEYALELLAGLSFNSFRITARRSEKNFPYSALQINEEVGRYIVESLGKKVNLGSPEVNCYIDLLQRSAFVYLKKIRGPGGLPVGISGKVVAMLSGGIDSPLAAFYAMKRGARVVFLHFHSVPYTSRASIEKVREIVALLNRFEPRPKLILVKLLPIQKEILMKTDEKFRVILYRRFMLRIAEVIARQERASAIVTGESLGQVASQTLDNMGVIEEVTRIPVLRPLVGFDKQEIVNQATKIGTYEVSIQPDQDCCSLFVPKHPATKARISDIVEAEKVLDTESLVRNAVENISEETIGVKSSSTGVTGISLR